MFSFLSLPSVPFFILSPPPEYPLNPLLSHFLIPLEVTLPRSPPPSNPKKINRK